MESSSGADNCSSFMLRREVRHAREYIKENVSEDVHVIVTDDFPSYPKAMIEAGIHSKKHETIKHSERVYVDGDITTNGIDPHYPFSSAELLFLSIRSPLNIYRLTSMK